MPNQPERDGLTPSTAFRSTDIFVLSANPYVICTTCESVQRFSDMYDNECEDCHNNDDYDHESASPRERLYSNATLPKFQSDDKGKIISSPRIFSAELEAYCPDSNAMRNVERDLAKEVGITSDGSLSDNGVEFQTPLLRGANGEQAIRDICKVLNDNAFTVDKTTGLHIHLDGKGLLPRTLTTTHPIALKQLWQFYIVFDEVMLSFLPTSRRNNQFCRSMKDTARYTAVGNALNQRDIETLWYKMTNPRSLSSAKSHQKHSSRYHGVNLHILLADKHLEIRFHSGTINATKILEWTALHQRICDMATNNILVTAETMLALPLEQKTKMFFAILKLPARAQKYFERRQAQFAPKIRTTILPSPWAGEPDRKILQNVNTEEEESLDAKELPEITLASY